MYELFLTSADGVEGPYVAQNLKIFQGLCGMAPVHQFERVLTFEGPESGRLLSIPQRHMERRPQNQNAVAYSQLNKQLARQSYYVNVGYIVDEDNLRASGAESRVGGAQGSEQRTANVEELPGTIHFLDYPDPTYTTGPNNGNQLQAQSKKSEPPKPSTNTRLVQHLTDRKIPSLMTSISYKFRSERLQESYIFYRDNVTLTLARDLVRRDGMGNLWETVRQTVPKLEECVPFDGTNKWLLKASVEVTDEKAGPLMQRGIDELLRMKRDLAGFHELVIFDRDVFDTRVAAFLANARRR